MNLLLGNAEESKVVEVEDPNTKQKIKRVRIALANN
jgi:hypothetical protein